MQPHAYGNAAVNPDAPNLHDYPALTHAPQQWGEGIRFAHNGRPVEDLSSMIDDYEVIGAMDAAARHLGVSFGDVCDALKYLRGAGAI